MIGLIYERLLCRALAAKGDRLIGLTAASVTKTIFRSTAEVYFQKIATSFSQVILLHALG